MFSQILQLRQRCIQAELILVGVFSLFFIELPGRGGAILKKVANASAQTPGVIILWTIGSYAVNIKDVELFIAGSLERIRK